MLIHTYALQIASTGETIYTKTSKQRIVVWQKRACKRVLKDKRRTDRVRKAIEAGDVITAWINYDEFKKDKTLEELSNECRRVFKE